MEPIYQAHNFRSLKIWQKGMDLVDRCYQLTKHFPEEERFGLVSQMRRCSVSIPSNIAEGSAFNTGKTFIRHLQIAYGSAFELETQLLIAVRNDLLSESDFAEMAAALHELQKMLYAFTKQLRERG
jgi:four helix bundle protein